MEKKNVKFLVTADVLFDTEEGLDAAKQGVRGLLSVGSGAVGTMHGGYKYDITSAVDVTDAGGMLLTGYIKKLLRDINMNIRTYEEMSATQITDQDRAVTLRDLEEVKRNHEAALEILNKY